MVTAIRVSIPLPTGTVTFLFTDIEGSTRMWEKQPRAMQAAVARHDVVLREAIEQEGGYVFKTVGDAFCAAFPTAPQALDAALSAQRMLNSTQWDGTDPLRVRMALHTGVAELRDNDYFGQPLNRVARLLSTGYGGQVLLSLATQQLVRDHLPTGTDLKDLGEGGLRDLVKAEHVFQVVASDLPSEFPPLKSLDTQYVEPTAEGVEVHNPYKGLRAFQQADAPDFFGREALTRQLLQRLADTGKMSRFLAVVGPSGSGKSSVVRAGLIPALRQGKVPGSERWLSVEMLPGPRPLEELEAVLLRIAVNPPEHLISQLQENERGLARAVKRVLPADERVELVLVIDQFEEVFTLVEDEPSRVHFLDCLCAAVKDPRSRLRVIVTLRADFYDRPLLHTGPAELFRKRTEVVLPLTSKELERAIVEPAKRMGVSLEPELLAVMVKDVYEQPGPLPLIQYTLTELFERRTGRTMTVQAYQESGGLTGALTRRAEELYQALSTGEKEACRQLFLRLVTLGEGVEDTRRRVRLAELTSAMGTHFEEEASSALDGVLDAFGKYRLLTFDRDPVTNGPTVEVAHEALIRRWRRLQEWLDESRADLRVQRQLMAEAIEWEHSGKEPSYLATGARLAQFEVLAEGAGKPGGVALTHEERVYLTASAEERERRENLEKERQTKEIELQKRAAVRLRALAATLGVFLVLATILSALAFVSTASAQESFTHSEAQRLAAEANLLLQGQGNPELVALLSISSMLRGYTPQGDRALAAASRLEYPARVFDVREAGVWGVAFSPDGKQLLTGSFDRVARLWDVERGTVIREFKGHERSVRDLVFLPDGRHFATASSDGRVRLWDRDDNRQPVRTFEGHTEPVIALAVDRAGHYLLSGSEDGTARLWEVSTGRELRRFTHEGPIYGVDFSPAGEYALTGSLDGRAVLWDLKSGSKVRAYDPGGAGIWSVVFSPDGDALLTGHENGAVIMWDVQTGKEVRRLEGLAASVAGLAVSPDGRYILTASGDATARIWEAATGREVRRFTDIASYAYRAVFSPDGRYAVIGSEDKTARLWDLQQLAGLPHFAGHRDALQGAAFSADGNMVLTTSSDDTSRVWDAHTGKDVLTLEVPGARPGFGVFSPHPNERLALIGYQSPDNTARLWDTITGRPVVTFAGHAESVFGVAFSTSADEVLTASYDGTAKRWSARTGELLMTYEGHTEKLTSVAQSRDGKYVLTAAGDHTARLWDASTGEEIRTYRHDDLAVYSAVFSPDGKYVLTASGDKTAWLWDTLTGEQVRRFRGHTDTVNNAVFSADGKYVLTASADKTARLWESATGLERRRFTGHAAPIYTAVFSPGGRQVLTAGDDRVALLWDVDYGTTVSYLCSRLLRDFTEGELRQYEIAVGVPTCPNH